jgi:S1-C subfamily serine protease
MWRLVVVLLMALVGCETGEEPAFQPSTDAIPGVLMRSLNRAQLRDAGLDYGLVVVKILPPADRAALRPGDVIVAVNRKKVRSIEEFNQVVQHAAGTLSLAVRRGKLDFLVALERSAVAPDDYRLRRPATGTLLRT